MQSMTCQSFNSKQARRIRAFLENIAEGNTVYIFSRIDYILVQEDDRKGHTIREFKMYEDGTSEPVLPVRDDGDE
jgi:hypothetical protein